MRLWLLLLSQVILASCSTTNLRLQSLSEYREAAEHTITRLPYPIILLHGLGQKADVWNEQATVYFDSGARLVSGGHLKAKFDLSQNKYIVTGNETGLRGGDYFTIDFTNPYDSVDAWALELESCIDYVLRTTGADRVVIIGYSMGGLAARRYLTLRYTNHRVRRLITVGTPHLGSAFARVYNIATTLRQCSDSGNAISAPICRTALSTLRKLEQGAPFDSPAIRDLRRPLDGGLYIRRLGKLAHPGDLDYVSIIGRLNMFDEVKSLSEGFVQEALRRAFSIIGEGLPALFEPGDGVVSTQSQDIMNIEWFTILPNRRRAARTVSLPTVHVNHLRQSTEIQRLSLDDRPELKGVDIKKRDSHALLVVDFTDYLPLQCSVEVVCKGAGINSLRLEPERMFLTKGNNGLVMRAVIGIPLEVASASDPSFVVRVRNSYGHIAELVKMWE